MALRILDGIRTAFFVSKEKLSGNPLTDNWEFAVMTIKNRVTSRKRCFNI